ncbi:RanBP1 domain protein [Aspergillus stella-maris]|uniref:RanBP1 domain protein n=1 Tax=Aspergillus stella-maris TaxID=1810926 RepID=UPI003CCCDC17
MNSTPDDKPQRATAAQLANRKILKGRAARAPRPSTGTPGSFGGPFSSIDPNTVSSPSANQQPTNGFTFGQSQSFPPTSSNPPPQAQNGGSQFSFGSGGGAPSFNFSTSFGGTASQPASNPFASMNTGGITQQQSGTGFTGFNGSMFNVPASGSQSPAQQPLPSGGMFGAGSQQNSSTGGIFGGAANSAPSLQSGTPAPSNGTMFGQSTTSAPSTTLFGQSSTDKPNPFAQSSAFGNDSMQTSPDAKSAAQKPSGFSSGSGGFGVSTNFGSTGTGNLFGGTSSAPAQTPSKPLFGAKPSEQTASPSTPLFGAPASSTPAASATPSFSAAPSTTGASTSSLFSSSTSKPATSTQNLFQSSTNLFGAPSSSTAEKPSEKKPKEDTKASQPSLFQPAASTPSSTPGASFTLSQPAPTGTEPEKPQANPTNPFSSLFVPGSSVTSSNLFSPKPASTEPAKVNELSKASTSASPFSAPTLSKPSSPAPQSPAFSFSKPQAPSSTPTFTPPAASSSPFKINGAKPDAAPASPSATVSTVKSFDKLQPAKMPSNLDKGTQDEVESRELAKLEPGTHDFDTVIQFYLRAGTKRKASVDSSEATNVHPAPAAPSPSAAPKPTPSTSSKRKAAEDDDKDASASPSSKRVSGGDSTTASIFANSFSRSKNPASDEPAGPSSPKKLDAPKPSLFSTTPTSSPPKPTFSSSTAPKESTAAKPLFTAPSSSTPAASPFTLKPSGEKSASFPAPSFAIPKFGSGGTTNFMSQFKAQSDKDAEKEKAKRKAEDFDSDEDDEAEWERKDAENQRKKREEMQAQQNRRAKFIPGKGFSFDEETASTDEEKSDTSPSASVLDSKTSSFGKSSNIFGHLSATPSESGNDEHDDADDTEEDSTSGDDAKDLSFAPNADEYESSSGSSKAYGTLESSDEGDFLKALKKSKQAEKTDDKEQASGGRSLFDRVEYGEDGKPKRQGEDDKNASSILGSSKFSSSFNSSSSTPNPFASSTPKPASNPFGSSSGSGASTPSIFATGSSAAKPGSDNTWKADSPIKFASGTTPAKSDSTSTAPAAASSNPFSTLFGASSTGSKPGSSGSQETAGFSFGGPSQPASSSLLTPSILSGTPSRASTPGVASDTGAEESGDGEAAESLPQVDLSRGGAGEENEDVVFEVEKCRAMRLDDKPPAKAGEPPKKEWETIGMGNLRILKDKTTSRTRILVRAQPSGNVVLNTRLMKEIKYTLSGTYIQFLVPQAAGPPKQWTIRGKKEEAPSIVAAMEKYKS